MKLRTVVAAAIVTALPLIAVTAPAEAVNHNRHFKNCTAMQKVYKHGVGKKGAKDRTSGKRVTNFKVDNRLYAANNGPRRGSEYDLDRDNDGIACEKR